MAPNCPICDASSTLEANHPEADLYRCGGCDHCFSDLASLKVGMEGYGRDYFEDQAHNWFENPNIGLFEAVRTRLEPLGPDASILDMGCGNGDLLAYLRDREPRMSLTGIDLAPQPPIQGVTLLHGDLYSTSFDRLFDAVISLAVIEHVPDVHTYMQNLAKITRPGGLIIIMTVNDRGVFYGTARMMRRLGMVTPFNRLYSKHHLNHFNISSLNRLVGLTGLTVKETLRHNSPMASVDIPKVSRLESAVFRLGIKGLFLLGKMTGQTLLQTIVCEKPLHAEQRMPRKMSA